MVSFINGVIWSILHYGSIIDAAQSYSRKEYVPHFIIPYELNIIMEYSINYC